VTLKPTTCAARGRHRLRLVFVVLAVASLLPAAAVGGSGNGKIVFRSQGHLYAIDPASGADADLGPGVAPAWSPDGSQIAFLSGGGVSVMNADGGGRRVLHASADDRRPVWSPDGSRVAFVSGRPAALLVVDVAGGQARTTATTVLADSPPAWSPDGTRLAYIEGASTDLAVVGADGSDNHVLSAGPSFSVDAGPAWSPDGSWIAFSRTTGAEVALYAVAPEGGPVRRLTQNRFNGGETITPAWSPDGSRIAFTGATLLAYTKVGLHYTRDVYVTDAQGTLERRLTVVDARTPSNASPSWSPDGTRILFQSQRDWVAPSLTSAIYIMNADGTCETRVGQRAGDSPTWQPIPLAASAPPLRCADLELSVGNERGEVAAGGEERFRIEVKNLETEPATDVRLRAEKPTGGVFLSASTERGTCSVADGSLTCELGTLAVGDAIPVTVAARAAAVGVFSTLARATAREPDGNQSNNVRALSFEALPCGLVGTWNADTLVGTRGPDTICARSGADLVRGLAGNDSIDAGGGPDRIFPGAGRDSLALRAGADFVDSRDGARDKVSCGGERDLVLADRFDVMTGDCELVARPSLRCSTVGTGRSDGLVGGSRNDSICTLNGNDTVHAGRGADGVEGGGGNDTLHGGPGRDVLLGGEGYDTILVRDGERDRVRCGPQDDVVRADRLDVVARDCERVVRR
jgi:Tol biopolymer transport system component